ncbi:MAG: PilW family protein [Lacipirellulaceae bacterium]
MTRFCEALSRTGRTAPRIPLGSPARRGLTLVEMLVAMAITLLMMSAIVTVFANISGSVTRRRATIEMSGALRNVREILARDLKGATCPAVPWQRPESNHGYLELVEGPQNDYYPSPWLYDGPDADTDTDGLLRLSPAGVTPGIDLASSTLPGSNLRPPGASTKEEGRGRVVGSNEALPAKTPTDGRGLGDADDALMLTVRNESQPFVGRIPSRAQLTGATVQNAQLELSPENGGQQIRFPGWNVEELESPLAEVVWYAVENPTERDDARTFAFGEPGYRTIYRRALLIAPSLNYQFRVGAGGPVTGEGVVRVLFDGIDNDEPHLALASLIAFQERYDLSVRLEWDPLLGTDGRWVLKANSLADLTKRENRYEHHGLVFRSGSDRARQFPFAAYSVGSYSAAPVVRMVIDPEYTAPGTPADFRAVLAGGAVVAYEPNPTETSDEILDRDRRYPVRPLMVVVSPDGNPATARAVRNEEGSVVHVTRGLAPLGGQLPTQGRLGDDVMTGDVLAFDLRVYDPGAPLYAYFPGGTTSQRADFVVAPGDPAWPIAFKADVPGWLTGGYTPATDVIGNIATTNSVPFAFQRLGAYVDMGYGDTCLETTGSARGTIPAQFTRFTWLGSSAFNAGAPRGARFFWDGQIRLPNVPQNAPRRALPIAPGYSLYDTWSWHYENNGVAERPFSPSIDTAADGIDTPMTYWNDDNDNEAVDPPGEVVIEPRAGPDDLSERETQPPYDTNLRGVQVTLRAYERDSRQVRQTSVIESFVPE